MLAALDGVGRDGDEFRVCGLLQSTTQDVSKLSTFLFFKHLN